MSTATASTSFMPNGLLGSSLLDRDEFTPNGLLSMDTTQDDFRPTGLLGLGSSNDGEGDMFKPNGLLDDTSTPNGLVADVDSSESREKAYDGFVENGLLGSVSTGSASSSANDFFAPTGLLSNTLEPPYQPTPTQSLDDELPPLHKAFKLPTTSTSRAGPPTTSSITSVPSRFSVKVTNYDGKTIFLRKKSKSSRLLEDATSSGRKISNLLETPIHHLLSRAEVGIARKAAVAAKASKKDTNENIPSTSSAVERTLWVDRYRPTKFTELMGNERVARDTLDWVKQWDWCVFGKSNKGKKRSREGDDPVERDEYHRPREKILLLSGPPGLGKTTLAHVVANQAGYEVMEINASDARSGQIVDDRIRPALEAGHGVRSSKPLLLVIDEIDGATGAGDNSGSFVHKLVQLTQDKPRKKVRGRKEPHAKRPILRPIICICNDINAASLAKLRPHAFQVRYQRPADVHTTARLREICAIEGLKADSSALSTLVGIAQGDMRGCLNTLQFIKSKHTEINETIIRAATKGMKESETSISTVMNNLFSPLSKKKTKELGLNDESRYVGRLTHEIDSCGRENSIAIACFSHYTTLRRHEANFNRHEQAIEWLLTYDRITSAMYNDGDFALMPYIPYSLVGFFPLFQERGAPRPEKSTTDWENLQTTKMNEEIYKSLSRCLQTASTRHGGDFRSLGIRPVLQMEFAPLINRIISPPLRPLNNQIIRPEERTILTRLVDIMSTLELRFLQERGEDGQLSYRLEPAVDVFITYDGKRAADMTVPRYAVRHLVAGEIDARLNTQQDVVEKEGSGRGKTRKLGGDKDDGDDLEDGRTAKRARVEPTQIDIADRPPTDFFGRLIVPSADTTSKSNTVKRGGPVKDVIKQFRVSFKYAEGNSAAVRRPVKMKAFM